MTRREEIARRLRVIEANLGLLKNASREAAGQTDDLARERLALERERDELIEDAPMSDAELMRRCAMLQARSTVALIEALALITNNGKSPLTAEALRCLIIDHGLDRPSAETFLGAS